MTTSCGKKALLYRLSAICISFAMLVGESCEPKKSKASATNLKSDKQGNCIINTSGLSEANGINIDVYYPCSWIEVHTNDNHPTLILQVGIMPEDITANMGLTVTISKIEDTLTSDKLEKLIAEIYSKGKSKVMEGIISTDTLEINGVKGGEIITRKTTESGQILYNLNIQLYFENNLIQLIYAVGAPTENEATSVFEKQKAFFRGLAKRTKFYEKAKP